MRRFALLCLATLLLLGTWRLLFRATWGDLPREWAQAALRTGPLAAVTGGGEAACADNTRFLVGSGRYDITGPAAELGMMGYGKLSQRTTGLHTRLWARAFVVASPCNGQRAVFVSADLLHLPQAVKQQVVERLRRDYGELYTDANVLLSATHTHSGPGGYSHYALYNLTVLGFDAQNFEAVVDGIHRAIVRAHEDLGPGTLRVAAGPLEGASINRSPEAYLRNPAGERGHWGADVDTTMTVLRLDREDGRAAGLVSWFAVHATSMGNDNTLISGDNKGYASQLLERRMGVRAPAPGTFVAAFAQSNAGDVSPNVHGGLWGRGPDDFQGTALSARLQASRAQQLYDGAREQVRGGVDFRHAYVRFDDVTVAPEFGGGRERHTCPAALGVSFLAGAEDGPGVGREGVRCQDGSPLGSALSCAPFTTPCQAEKPIVLETGTLWPYPWTPEVLPVQVLTLGQLALVAVPFEITTMAGRRLRETVQAELAPAGVTRVVVAALANAYAGYVTTQEEYGLQHYEGASTHFGPWTLAAIQQHAAHLARALREGEPVAPGPTPRDLRGAQVTLQTGVVMDAVPLFARFGDVVEDAAPTCAPGDTVRVTFWGAHPKSDLRRQDGYLEVQRWTGSAWEPVAGDDAWETRYRWQRGGCLGCSLVTAEWDVPATTPPGTYRIQVRGGAKGLTGRVTPYEGTSRAFEVQRPALSHRVPGEAP